ncbi:hypothetical protein WKE96_16715 [Edwardsiella tarda]|uniref:Uncharacterized protein n=1 Tax=Edwardsiella tarda TaxID=636 RepID=A0A2S1PMK6_EDWTA|nr:hypothetical protein [Edwardsiella tarda]
MGFVSQLSASRAASSRIGNASIVATQSFKPSTNAQEFSIRVTSLTMSKAGIGCGDSVDVLYSDDDDLWMIKKMERGLKISGKPDAPTGLIRYTLKEGHVRFTDKKDLLPVRRSSVEDSIQVSDGQIIFKLKSEED